MKGTLDPREWLAEHWQAGVGAIGVLGVLALLLSMWLPAAGLWPERAPSPSPPPTVAPSAAAPAPANTPAPAMPAADLGRSCTLTAMRTEDTSIASMPRARIRVWVSLWDVTAEELRPISAAIVGGAVRARPRLSRLLIWYYAPWEDGTRGPAIGYADWSANGRGGTLEVTRLHPSASAAIWQEDIRLGRADPTLVPALALSSPSILARDTVISGPCSP